MPWPRPGARSGRGVFVLARPARERLVHLPGHHNLPGDEAFRGLVPAGPSATTAGNEFPETRRATWEDSAQAHRELSAKPAPGRIPANGPGECRSFAERRRVLFVLKHAGIRALGGAPHPEEDELQDAGAAGEFEAGLVVDSQQRPAPARVA